MPIVFVLQNITYYLIFGKPLILYLGISTITSLLITATLGYLIHNGKTTIPFKWHMRMARLTVALALVHGTLGLLAYF